MTYFCTEYAFEWVYLSSGLTFRFLYVIVCGFSVPYFCKIPFKIMSVSRYILISIPCIAQMNQLSWRQRTWIAGLEAAQTLTPSPWHLLLP